MGVGEGIISLQLNRKILLTISNINSRLQIIFFLANWGNVFKKYPEQKIDLAHFGGMDIWLLMGSLENFSGTFEEIEASIFPG